jgi:hypothetical protein
MYFVILEDQVVAVESYYTRVRRREIVSSILRSYSAARFLWSARTAARVIFL